MLLKIMDRKKLNRRQFNESMALQLAYGLPLATVVHVLQCPAIDNLR